MREAIRDKSRLVHMLGAIDNVHKYSAGMNRKELETNTMAFHAIVYNIQIIGEAAYMLTKEFKLSHTEVEWRLIEGMRHVIVHDYYQVSVNEVWVVKQKDLQPLRQQIEAYLTQMENE